MPHPLILAGLLLAASPGGDPAQQQMAEIATLSASAGELLGAASACREISRDRILAVGQKVSDIVTATVSGGDKLAVLEEIFADSAADGKKSVQSGRTDCAAVARSLSEIERKAP